jgi:hypothetical protein
MGCAITQSPVVPQRDHLGHHQRHQLQPQAERSTHRDEYAVGPMGRDCRGSGFGQQPFEQVGMALLLGHEHPHRGDIVPVAGPGALGDEAGAIAVLSGLEPLHARDQGVGKWRATAPRRFRLAAASGCRVLELPYPIREVHPHPPNASVQPAR